MNDDKPVNLITCREGFESALAAESGGETHPDLIGAVMCSAPLNDTPYIFERQRMAGARMIPISDTKPLSRDLANDWLGQIATEDTLWTSHAWSADPDELSRVQGIEKALIAQTKKIDTGTWKCWRKPEKLAQRNTGRAVQLYRSGEQLWVAENPIDQLIDPFPGGIRRMKMDPDAPSRSYLKMEESLSYIEAQPQPGERVIDLGAAPGGWSWSFLKRGCHVTAIDNGPMKIEDPEAFDGSLSHERADGLTYEPAQNVDWMVSDMLVAPGQVIGMLRLWLNPPRTRHLIFNVKLPQQDMYAGLLPLKQFLERETKGELRIKQLYHDRREVSVFGTLKA